MNPSHQPGFITKPSSEFQDAPKQREASLPLTFYSSGSPPPYASIHARAGHILRQPQPSDSLGDEGQVRLGRPHRTGSF